MGLFDMFKKKAEPAAAAAPASISASAGADVLCSPVKGKVIKMADVPDPVFGGEVLGKGCAVWPEDDLVYAPCDGKVTVTMGHAFPPCKRTSMQPKPNTMRPTTGQAAFRQN